MSEIDIVIVNYMSAAHTLKAVRTAIEVAHDDGVSVKIIVIDNGECYLDFEEDLQDFREVVLERNDTNVGFGAACNQGAALGDADVILFLNPDATLLPSALGSCSTYLRAHQNGTVGIVGPEIIDGAGNLVLSCSRFPTRKDLFIRSTGLHTIFRNTGYPFLSFADHETSGVVDQVMGAALFIRRNLFQKLGGFDQRFFLYYDDVDLCARAQKKGFSSYYLKDARVTHVGRASSSRNPGKSLALHIRSRLTYARIHFGRAFQSLMTVTSFLIELPARLIQASAGAGVTGWRGVLEAYWLLLSNTLPSSPPRTDKM